MSTDTQNTILEVSNLSVGYKKRKQHIPVYECIEFSLKSGEMTAIAGANGIGKSTLIRTLSNLQPRLNGHIKLKGKDLTSYSLLELASDLSLILTEALPSKNMTVKELVSLGRQPYTNWIGVLKEEDHLKINEAIKLVQLEEMADKKCFELSDGQLQKVLIARALAQDTSLIILDEPTTHLDIHHRAYILQLLKKIAHETGRTILYSTHEIDLAIQLCDKMLVMGKSDAFFGTPCELIEKGAFERLFPEGLVRFDPQRGVFSIYK